MIQDPIKILYKYPYTLIITPDLHRHAQIIYDLTGMTANDLCKRPIFSQVQRSFFLM